MNRSLLLAAAVAAASLPVSALAQSAMPGMTMPMPPAAPPPAPIDRSMGAMDMASPRTSAAIHGMAMSPMTMGIGGDAYTSGPPRRARCAA